MTLCHHNILDVRKPALGIRPTRYRLFMSTED